MATQGTVSGSGSNSTRVSAAWKVNKQSIEDNATSFTTNFTLSLPSTPYALTVSGTMSAGGVSKTFNVSIAKGATSVSLGSITAYVWHNADGTGGARITCNYSISSGLGSGSCSGWVNFDTIARQATLLTAPNFTDEENPTIVYNNPAGESVSSLSAAISFDGTNPDIAYRDVEKTGTTYTFNLTDAERKLLRQKVVGSNNLQLYFYLRTVIGEQYYFSYKQATLTVINANPTITASVVDTNSTTVALTGDNKTLIRYYSTAYASFTATATKEATIKTHVIEYNGGITSSNTKTVPNVDSNVFGFISADSRGNTANEVIVAPMIDYIRPTANIDQTELMDTSGRYVLNCSGNYYNDTFGYTSAAAANTLTVAYRYKEQGGSYSGWTAMGKTLDGNTYTATTNITGLDYRKAYIFQCRVVDALNNIESAEITVRSLPVFHWSETDFVFEVPVIFNAGAEGIGGGTAAQSEETLLSGGTIDGDLTITGDLRLKGSGNYGNTLFFGDGSYANISEPADDTLTIKATNINLNGNVLVNGSAIGSSSGSTATAGSWTPTLTTSAAVSSYSVRQGWYSKVGNVVSIGWQIKATINSGYNSTTIGISGCPYTPAYAAMGGGIAHNIYLAAGFCFEGWVIGTDGIITGRGQPCNNTSAGNLNITSSTNYPTGSGNVLTLAGSITFTI